MTVSSGASFGAWQLSAKPRDWQANALRAWQRSFRGVASVVTGAGKTVFAEMCMLAFREARPSGKVIVVVPTVALLDQWVVSLMEDLNVPEGEIGTFSGLGKSSTLKGVNIFVINTARQLGRYLKPNVDTFLIVDECHRAGSVMNAQALACEHQATLGLSATPEREYDSGFEEAIAPALGPIIYHYRYEDAYRDKVITPFELVNVRADFQGRELVEYERLTKRAAQEYRRIEAGSGSQERLRYLLQKRAAVSGCALMRVPVAAALAEQHRGKRTLIFHERIEAAAQLLKILEARKHSATIYNTRIGPVIRRDNLRMYRRGMFDVLISCRALDEGTNVPETAVAIIASSTASQRQRIQRLGRVLRPADGKEKATVVTIYITDAEEERLKKEAKRLGNIAKVTWLRGEKSHG